MSGGGGDPRWHAAKPQWRKNATGSLPSPSLASGTRTRNWDPAQAPAAAIACKKRAAHTLAPAIGKHGDRRHHRVRRAEPVPGEQVTVVNGEVRLGRPDIVPAPLRPRTIRAPDGPGPRNPCQRCHACSLKSVSSKTSIIDSKAIVTASRTVITSATFPHAPPRSQRVSETPSRASALPHPGQRSLELPPDRIKLNSQRLLLSLDQRRPLVARRCRSRPLLSLRNRRTPLRRKVDQHGPNRMSSIRRRERFKVDLELVNAVFGGGGQVGADGAETAARRSASASSRRLSGVA